MVYTMPQNEKSKYYLRSYYAFWNYAFISGSALDNFLKEGIS